jgi:hypothetical protein
MWQEGQLCEVLETLLQCYRLQCLPAALHSIMMIDLQYVQTRTSNTMHQMGLELAGRFQQQAAQCIK